MRAEATSGLPSPWKQFFTEIDGALTEPRELHCIGGFALVHHYGLSRTTGDVDYDTAVPNERASDTEAEQYPWTWSVRFSALP